MKILPSIQPWEVRLEKVLTKLTRTRNQVRDLKKKVNQLELENLCLRQPQIPPWARPNLSLRGRKKRRKKPGPKPGHPAFIRTIPPDESINEEITFAAESCPNCSSSLRPPSSWHTHTQIDLAEFKRVWVTRYYIGYSYCSQCRARVCMPPKDRKGMLPFSKYGARLHAIVTYWKFGLGLSLGKIQMQLEDEVGLKISTGELSEMLENSARKLEPIYNDLRLVLRSQHHLYVDETGWRNSGDNYWLWSFSNENFSYYRIEKRRNRRIVRNTLGLSFNGILVSDFYGAYNEIKCRKQKCWSHILRTTHQLKEGHPDDVEIHLFHKKFKALLKRGKKLKAAYFNGTPIQDKYLRLKKDTLEFLRSPVDHPKLKKLQKRLLRHKASIYTFIKYAVDPTNNLAEREIRPAVLMRKDQFCNRSLKGSHTQEILMSVIRTCFKQNINYLDLATKLIASP